MWLMLGCSIATLFFQASSSCASPSQMLTGSWMQTVRGLRPEDLRLTTIRRLESAHPLLQLHAFVWCLQQGFHRLVPKRRSLGPVPQRRVARRALPSGTPQVSSSCQYIVSLSCMTTSIVLPIKSLLNRLRSSFTNRHLPPLPL